MNADEVNALLGYVQAVDNRTITEEMLLAWTNAMPRSFEFDIACEAVDMHRRESTDYLQPAHLVACYHRVLANRQRRLAQLAPKVAQLVERADKPWWFDELVAANQKAYREAVKANGGRHTMTYGPYVEDGPHPPVEAQLAFYGITDRVPVAAPAPAPRPVPTPRLNSWGLVDPEEYRDEQA